MTRQRHGDGSVFQRKDGRWVFQMVLENGKKKPYYFKTEKEALKARRKLLYEKEQGTLAAGPQQTLGVYLEKWLEQVCKLTMRPNTYKAYRSAVNSHLIPSLGHMKLQRLTGEHLQAFFAERQERLKPRSLRLIQSALNSALDDAVKWGLVARNVGKLVDLPHAERYEGQALTEDQARRLLEAARGSRLDVLLLVALTTGMRRGELMALRWSDLDFESAVLQVRRNLARMPGVGYVEREPKT